MLQSIFNFKKQETHLKKFALFITVLISILLTGCVRIAVNVDSIGDQPKLTKLYILSSGMSNINDNDLQFKEYARYVNNALQEKGYQLSDFGNANIGIMLSYGISEPHTKYSISSKPIYGQTGVSSSFTTGSINTFGNMASLNANTTYTQNDGVIGTKIKTTSNTTYDSFITLHAIDLNKYRITKEMEPIWKITMVSNNGSSDLRKIFPIILGAGKEYIGTNTGKSVRIIISENDERVLTIKNNK